MKNKILYQFGLCLLAAFMFMCSSKESKPANETAVVESSHPLGQASVVDNVSDKNILQVAAGSQAHTTLVTAVQAAQIENVLIKR